jgi:hypothetical protein
MKNNNRFVQDALNRFAEEWDGIPFNTTTLLFQLKLRNGKKLHKSRFLGGGKAQYQAQSLAFALKRHPKYYKTTERLDSKTPPLWGCLP